MPSQEIKATQLITCPHCSGKVYVAQKVKLLGIVGTAKKEDVDKLKQDLIQQLSNGTFPKPLSPEMKNVALDWLSTPSNILLPEDVQDFIDNL